MRGLATARDRLCKTFTSSNNNNNDHNKQPATVQEQFSCGQKAVPTGSEPSFWRVFSAPPVRRSMPKMTWKNHRRRMDQKIRILEPAKLDGVVLLVFCCFLLFSFTGVYCQKEKEPKKPETVKELFNTSSCIPKPYRCPHPRIQFFLYTRRTQKNPEMLDITRQESLYNSQFNRANPTKIVVHGFGGGRNLSPSTDMREAYFKRGNYNIIIVDYGTLVREPCLKQMEWAPRFCAKCISQLVHYLTTHPRGLKADHLHMIGYSVGAHISGLVANYLDPTVDGKLGRITGLDPTIVFYMGKNRSRDLDQTDAHFVDVLHTGAGILGQWGPNGHADFYINGGSSQPGCASDTIFKTLACDHTKVTPYFIESIITPKGFWAYPCPTLLSYMLGWCSPEEQEYVLMGEHVTHKARGIYYVTTNAYKPYAQGHPGKRKRPQGPPPRRRPPSNNKL